MVITVATATGTAILPRPPNRGPVLYCRFVLAALLLCLAPVGWGWERYSSGQVSMSQNYVNTERAGNASAYALTEVRPSASFALSGGRTRLGMNYGVRGQLNTLSGGTAAFHQFRLDARRWWWQRRLSVSAGAGRGQSLLRPETGLVGDYRIGGGNLSDVDEVRASAQWQGRLRRWLRLSAEGGWSANRLGGVASQGRLWSAVLSQGHGFRRLLWSLHGTGRNTVGAGRETDQSLLGVSGGLALGRHWTVNGQVQEVWFRQPDVFGQIVRGGGRVYRAGVTYRPHRRANLDLYHQRGYFGRGVTGSLDYRHRRLTLRALASRDLVNGLGGFSLGLGGTGGVAGGGLPGGAGIGVPGAGGLSGPGGGFGPGLPGVGTGPGVGVVAIRNEVFILRSERLVIVYGGRRLSQQLYFNRSRYESQRDGSVSRYDDWGIAPGWRLGGRTQIQGQVGGRYYSGTSVVPVRLTTLAFGATHALGARTHLRLDGVYYRQVGGVRGDDFRLTAQLTYRWWP